MSEIGAKIFIFTGTSGSGRKTVAARMREEFGLTPILSFTTRLPRPKELPGQNYHFISREEFIEADIHGEFIETAEIDNVFYGIKRKPFAEALVSGKPLCLVLNRYGASKLKYEFGDRVVRIFLYTNKQAVRERLEAHGESPEVIDKYLDHYMEEVVYRKDCEHVCENLDLGHTLNEVRSVIARYINGEGQV